MKKILITLVLYFFCINVAFSKPEMYYCIEEGSTGFKSDKSKKKLTQQNWFEDKFKLKLDLEDLTIESGFNDAFIDTECQWLTVGFNMACFDRFRSQVIKIKRVDENFNNFEFIFANLGILTGIRSSDLKISYGNCEKF